ncbi:hybrid sensor histidine kinase/response regulator transcription factor [Desertivirga brevis]|uniref:hybrid sensor histidine kinase/response regulator transcription factor n=1 Tax=Desertivirga brevis TaxID=2810310 RepID=UPI001A977BE7|nr:two-component regulator propeller domain-containing protein [Pedobacter sp. SYSU D00873]
MPYRINHILQVFFILLLALLFDLPPLSAQKQRARLKFQHLTTDDGLSNNTVESICQDKRGFVWFGTRDGLNRYDGTKIKIFRNKLEDTTSISENLINDIYVDKQGNLWVATADGLNLFLPKTEKFQHFSPGKSLTEVRDIVEEQNGNLLLGTNKGLYSFDTKNRRFSRWTNYRSPEKIDIGEVNKLLLDKQGFLWVGAENGLYQIELKTRKTKYFKARPGNPRSIQSPVIHELFEDSQGRIWVGMSEGGLALFNRTDGSMKTFKADPKFALQPTTTNSLPHNDVRSIVESSSGVLWVGTENGGLCIFDTRTYEFTTYQPDKTDPQSLNHDSLHSLFKDNQGNIWIGTWAGGVNFYSPALLKFPLFNKFPQASFPGVESISRDKQGIIWMGVVENGLYSLDPKTFNFVYYPNPNISRFEVGIYFIKEFNKDTLVLAVRRGGMAFFDKRTEKFTHYLPQNGKKNSIGGHELNTVLVDRHKNVWCGGWNMGISRFNYKTKDFSNYRHRPADSKSLNNDLVYTIFEDRQGRIWIGTDGGGLEQYNPRTNSFNHHIHKKGDLKSISHNTVISIFEDKKGRFWVGTSNGLNLMDRRKGTFSVYTQKDGLPNDVIKSIIEDTYGNLWLGTNKGLSCFNPEKEEFRNFSVKDGLQGSEFLMNACSIDLNGNLYFSGYKGLNIFHPAKINFNRQIPPVILTDFQLANKPVAIGAETSPLQEHISETKELRLTYDQSVFSFEFAALNYISPDKNQYAYKMEGFDDDWNYVGSKHTATYTNLDPGSYTFRVIASNNDGVWNTKGAYLRVVIKPPFWETWWFRLLIIALLLTAAYKYLSFRRLQELKELEEKKREEMQQVQLQFFTNISHEFRTPLSLIIGPLEKLLQPDPTGGFKQYYKVMYKNANRLMGLINELMDFRKIESGALRLKASLGNLDAFIAEIAEDFENTAAERNITYTIQTSINRDILFDRQVLEKILLNLINNSFKYTADGGSIEIRTFDQMPTFNPKYHNTHILKNNVQAREYIYISVVDTGIGISRDSIQHLFQRYYRIADAHLGSGVGLAFVKSLTFLHKGEIFVSSERHQGTEIIVAIPSSATDYKADEKKTIQNDEPEVKLESLQFKEDNYLVEAIRLPGEPIKQEDQTKHLLLVDDNEELRNFLKDSLIDLYQISEAKNGREGLLKAKEVSPDLIISDVMMPDMDGIKFCKLVKNEMEISHIPFMMLTAKNTLQSEIEGVESGADYYFTKPISIQLLKLTLKNLFSQRQKLKEHYTQDRHAEVRELVHTSKDKEFLDKLLLIIESQLINPDLDIEFLCKEIGMSRTKLYQKIKSITGQSIGEFVRTIRLRKAIEIMTHEDVPLSDVIFRVGIQTQSYFTKAFKKEFGKTPSQFLNDIKRQ